MTPTICGLLGLFIFSFGTLLIALSGDIPAFQLSGMLLLGGSFCLWLGLHCVGAFRYADVVRQPFRLYCITVSGIGLYTILLNWAFKIAPPYEVNIVNYLWPVFLVLFSRLLNKETFLPNEWIGIMMGFIGVIYLFIPSDTGMFLAIGLGHLLALAAAMIWAFYSAVIVKENYSVSFLVPVFFISGSISLVMHFAFEETVFSAPISVWGVVFVLILSRLSYVLWDYGMRKGDKQILAVCSYFVPLLSVSYFIALGIVPERIEAAIGGVFVICGCLAGNWHRIRSKIKGV